MAGSAAERPVDRRSDVERLGPWFHNLHLPDGTQTAPDHFLGDFPSYKWAVVARLLPEDLRGWHALDVGCNAGFYTFALARRGASVLGIDLDERYLAQARWAAREFGVTDSVDFRRMQAYELAQTRERFDLVLFMGVFYHLRYPLLGLDIVSRLVDRVMVFQTLTTDDGSAERGAGAQRQPADFPIDQRDALRRPDWPAMAFVEHQFAGDPTNWWIPNAAGVESMLRSAGLRVVERPGHEIWLCEPAPGAPDGPPYDFTSELLAATGRPWRHDTGQSQ
jgi:tRNA (mo5U34)-methyltransferase